MSYFFKTTEIGEILKMNIGYFYSNVISSIIQTQTYSNCGNSRFTSYNTLKTSFFFLAHKNIIIYMSFQIMMRNLGSFKNVYKNNLICHNVLYIHSGECLITSSLGISLSERALFSNYYSSFNIFYF